MNLPRVNTHTQGVYVSVEELLGLRFFANNIKLSSTRSSSSTIDGETRSRYRGRGMEFSEVRPYHPGDDIRNIDWRVTARTQQTYTKLFQEEKERPVYIVADQRSSTFFGSQGVFKSVFIARLAALIGWAALKNKDRIGAMVFSDEEQVDLRAKRGKHAQLSLIHQLSIFTQSLTQPYPADHFIEKKPNETSELETPNQKIQSLNDILKEVRHVAKPGSAIFILSDFNDFNDDSREPLSMLSRHTDVHMLHVYDELESKLPSQYNLTVTDGMNRTTLSNSDRTLLNEYHNRFSTQVKNIADFAQTNKIIFSSNSNSISTETLIEQLFGSASLNQRSRNQRFSKRRS